MEVGAQAVDLAGGDVLAEFEEAAVVVAGDTVQPHWIFAAPSPSAQ
jgi:hypothetical protein